MTTATKTGKRKIPLSVAGPVAEKLRAALAPYCERIEIAGSIRRGKDEVGDIEIVAIPKIVMETIREKVAPQQMALFGESCPAPNVMQVTYNALDRRLENFIAREMLARDPARAGIDTPPAWGARYKKLFVPLSAEWGWMQLDLFLATAENWGAIFTIRTGPSVWSNALVTYVKDRTPYRQQGGELVRKATGQPVPVRTERAYFDVLRLPWVEPGARTNEGAWAWFREQGARVKSARMSYNNDKVVRAVIRRRLEGGLYGGET